MTTPNTGPTIPRGTCLSCGAAGEHRYIRKMFMLGDGYHVWAACLSCGDNARGSGQWVALAEVREMGFDPDALPTSSADPRQGVLL